MIYKMPNLGMINAVYLLLLLLLLAAKETLCLTKMRIHVPAIVKSGDTVTMSCEYDLEEVPLYSIKWYWNDEEFYRFVPKESPPYRAFKVKHVYIDISRSGPTDVTLTNVVRELSGDYKCEVSADAPFFHTDIKVAPMIVVDVPTNAPVLSTEIVDEDALDRKIIARCQSPLSVPKSNISWYINEKLINRYNPRIKITPLETTFENEMGYTSFTSILQLMIDKSIFINGKVKIRCDTSIYSIWNKSSEAVVQEDSFQLDPPPAVSTSSQSQMDHVVEIISSSSSGSYLFSINNIVFSIIMLMLALR